MPTIGKRLLEERKRLNMNQTDFGQLGGVSKTTQLNYEAGTVSPDANYLSGIALAGADLMYILTGHRTDAQQLLHGALSVQEKAIVETWAALDDEGRQRLASELDRVKQETTLKRRVAELEASSNSSTATMTFNGSVGNAAGRDLIKHK